MHKWIILLRGINVGGKNIVPMKALRDLLSASGFDNVKSYIQSGNCVAECAEGDANTVSEKVSAAIEAEFGFAPRILTLSLAQFQKAIERNPYPQGVDNPKCLHFYFLAAPANDADMEALSELKAETEAFTLTDSVLYLYAPDGIGRSKFAARAESKLGVAATARNYRTVLKLAELANIAFIIAS